MLKHLLISLAAFLPGALLGSNMISGVSVPSGAQEFEFFPTNGIRMDVAFDWEFKEHTKQSKDFTVWIYCRWTNTGDKEVKLLLKDHDHYHGTLDYPWGVQVRLTQQGKGKPPITGNSTNPDGWWSSSLVQSQFSEIMPGDVITLLPQQSVVRQIPLHGVLSGLSMDSSGTLLPSAGSFRVDLRLGKISASPQLLLIVK